MNQERRVRGGLQSAVRSMIEVCEWSSCLIICSSLQLIMTPTLREGGDTQFAVSTHSVAFNDRSMNRLISDQVIRPSNFRVFLPGEV